MPAAVFPVVTTDDLPGRRIKHTLGLLVASSVRVAEVASSMGASFQAFTGDLAPGVSELIVYGTAVQLEGQK